jgi:hypothetical protein
MKYKNSRKKMAKKILDDSHFAEELVKDLLAKADKPKRKKIKVRISKKDWLKATTKTNGKFWCPANRQIDLLDVWPDGIEIEIKATPLKADKPKEIERSGWHICNRCGAKFYVIHAISESGALCNDCFDGFIKETHPELKKRPEWEKKFDKLFTRKSKGLEDKGEYRDDWFVRETTSRQVKDFIRSLLLEPVKTKPEIEKLPTTDYLSHDWPGNMFSKLNELIDRVNILSSGEDKTLKVLQKIIKDNTDPDFGTVDTDRIAESVLAKINSLKKSV